ncbi:hypothetical protein [Pseudaestuariivita sp.]|uniref:hypothetical protein n=1 Tax=Pseudaestuariivita sp. TaxID=2211669 RepID=UPI004057EA9C
MKALIWSLASLVLASTAFSGTLQEIQARGTLRACFAPIHPSFASVAPAGCTEDCRFSGLHVEQARAFAKALGVTLDPSMHPWQSQFEDAGGAVRMGDTYVPRLLADGTCDVLPSNLARLPWRLKMMEIVPLFSSHMIAVIHEDDRDRFSRVAHFAGKRTAVVPGSSFESWLMARNLDVFAQDPVELVPLGGRGALEMVADRSVDFSITDADIAVLTARVEESSLLPAFTVGPVQELGWGVSKDSVELQQALARFFAAQRDQGRSTINRAWIEYLGVSINGFEALVGSLSSDPGTSGLGTTDGD